MDVTRYSLLLQSPKHLDWIEEPLPEPKMDELLVRTRTGAISVGTEIPLFRGDSRGNENPAYPIMTGYESVGEVIACGSAVVDFKPGDRVIATYGHRTHAAIPASKAIPVPDTISDAVAILSILSCDVTKGINKLSLSASDKVLITGAGTIGLLTLLNLRARGIAHVDVIEPLPARQQLALDFGASRVGTPEGDYTIGVECSSRDQAFHLLQHKMKHNSKVLILADGNLEPLTLAPCFHKKELQIIASSDGLDYPGHARWFFQAAQTIQARLHQLYDLTCHANELPTVFGRIAEGEIRPIKVLVNYENFRESI